jgi:hypothetical protein
MAVTGFLPINEIKRKFRCRLPIAWRVDRERINPSTESILFSREPLGGKLHFAAWRKNPRFGKYGPLAFREVLEHLTVDTGTVAERVFRKLIKTRLFQSRGDAILRVEVDVFLAASIR